MDSIIELILTRRSCRSFQDKQVSIDDVNSIIECGLSAPSGMNEQPWFIVALMNKDIMNKLNENVKLNFLQSQTPWRVNWAKESNFNFYYNSPVFILVFGNEKNYYSNIDCALTIENMSLACEDLGLASCIIGDVKMLDEKILTEYVKVPQNYKIVLDYPLATLK